MPDRWRLARVFVSEEDGKGYFVSQKFFEGFCLVVDVAVDGVRVGGPVEKRWDSGCFFVGFFGGYLRWCHFSSLE